MGFLGHRHRVVTLPQTKLRGNWTIPRNTIPVLLQLADSQGVAVWYLCMTPSAFVRNPLIPSGMESCSEAWSSNK